MIATNTIRVSGRRCALGLVAITTLVGAGGCGNDQGHSSTVAAATPIALHVTGAPSGLRIGVIVSLTSGPGQGADWHRAAEGAEVAAYRYSLGHTTVTLEPVNDKGTAAGARAAVAQLVGDHVAGIVVATDGSHVRAAVTAAKKAGVAALLPYSPDLTLPATAWATGPTADQLSAALDDQLTALGASQPLVVDAGGGTPTGLTGTTVSFHPGGDMAALITKINHGLHSTHADAIVITGDAATQAAVVSALQGHGIKQPLIVGPPAPGPDFGTDLTRAGGSVNGALGSVGLPDPDATALTRGAGGAAASAFLAALRAAADDPHVTDFFDDQSFGTVADAADERSHDAVVALVTAAVRAKSTDPAAVLATLQHLTVTASDGLAGPTLDFSQRDALPDTAVHPLESTTQSTDLRPTSDQARLYWYSAAAD